MKKPILFILITLCALLLAACGSDAPKQDTASDTPAGGEMVAFHLSVNPQLTLYTDTEGIAQAVEPHNAAAEEVCKNLDLTHLPLQEAFDKLVGALHAAGYLEGRDVTIEVALPPSQMPTLPDWENAAVEAWSAALGTNNVNGVSFQITATEDASLSGDNTSPPQDNAAPPANDDLFDEILYDDAGNIVQTVDYDTDGNKVTAIYESYPTATEITITFLDGSSETQYYNTDGTVARLVFVCPEYTRETTYENGVETYQKEYGEQGSTEWFFENGEVRRQVTLSNGAEIVTLYDAGGNRISTTSTSPTFCSEEEYHPDGWLQRRYTKNADGEWQEHIYQGDGVLLSEENSRGWKYIYDAAGRKVEGYDIDNFGQRTHIFFLPDGRDVVYTHKHDGSVQKVVMNGNHQEVGIENYTGPETATP